MQGHLPGVGFLPPFLSSSCQLFLFCFHCNYLLEKLLTSKSAFYLCVAPRKGPVWFVRTRLYLNTKTAELFSPLANVKRVRGDINESSGDEVLAFSMFLCLQNLLFWLSRWVTTCWWPPDVLNFNFFIYPVHLERTNLDLHQCFSILDILKCVDFNFQNFLAGMEMYVCTS